MRFGSLFTGIGGFDLGFERAGMQCAWQVERDQDCLRWLEKHWPDVPRYADVVKFCRRIYDCDPVTEDGEVWCPRCDMEFGDCECIGTDQLVDECGGYPDVICGGFPCQDVSNAGKRPAYVVVENTAGLSVRGMQRVLGDLAGSGYDAEWEMLPASAFGAVHRRERLFIVAYTAGNGLEGRDQAERVMQVPVEALDHAGHWPVLSEPFGLRGADGLSGGMDELKARVNALGNAVCPQVAEWIGKGIVEHHRQIQHISV